MRGPARLAGAASGNRVRVNNADQQDRAPESQFETNDVGNPGKKVSRFTALKDSEALWAALDSEKEDEALKILMDEYGLEDQREQAELICGKLSSGYATSIREALLLAVDLEKVGLVQVILAAMKGLGLEEDEAVGPDSTIFYAHMCPIILACFKNNFELVSILLCRGHNVSLPHRPSCCCKDCSMEKEGGGEKLETCLKRIDGFRALSSSAYLWLGSHDPFLLCFELSRELEKCVAEDEQHSKEYEAVVKKVREFSGEIAKYLRSKKEADLLLKRAEGYQCADLSFPYPRLRLALDNNMKEFIANFTIHSQLQNIWIGGWADQYQVSPWKNKLRWLSHTIFYPITSLLFIFSNKKLFRSYEYPTARFLSFFASYIVFLLLLIIRGDGRANNIRGTPVSAWELIVQWLIWAYVGGCIFWDWLLVFHHGPERYFKTWWNCFDVALWALFVVSFYGWIRSLMVSQDDGLSQLERKHWAYWDSALVSETFFSLAAIISFWRLFYFLQLNKFFGPTVISIGRCVQEISLYLIIMVVVIFSFGFGLSYLYHNYEHPPDMDYPGKQEQHFISTVTSIRRLYWSFYGYLPPEYMDIYVGTTGQEKKINSHYFTRTVGEFIAAVYNVIIVIVLLNLMVAMMVNSASEILSNQDTEWKFATCHVLSEFLEPSNAVPPPFNVLYWIFSWFPYLMNTKRRFQAWPNWFHYEMDINENDLRDYQVLIHCLFQRYTGKNHRNFRNALEFTQANEETPSKVALIIAGVLTKENLSGWGRKSQRKSE